MVPPNDKELGELIGEMRAVKESMAEMRKENAEDHAQVVKALDAVRDELSKKASKEEVTNVADRADKLESRSDKLMAVVALFVVLSPLIIGYLLQTTGGS